jgi:hypothetical protein
MPKPQEGPWTKYQKKQTLAQRVRAKHPGAYDDMDDVQLEKAVLAKYPEYSDLPRSTPTPKGWEPVNESAPGWEPVDESEGPWTAYQKKEEGPWTDYQKKPKVQVQTENTISAKPQGVGQWLRDLEGDVRYGGETTLPGRILKKMGAQGLNVGAQGNADTPLQSTPLGPIHALQGVAEKKPLKVAQGVLEAAEIPLSFSGPGGPKAAQMAEKGIAAAAGKVLPKARMARAGKMIEEASQVAKEVAVDYTQAGDQALKIQQLASQGNSMPKVIRDFLKRATDPKRPPITFEEAREFYSSASRLSAEEAQRLTPRMKKEVVTFTKTLGKGIQEAADIAGGEAGALYKRGMEIYANAAKWQRRTNALLKTAKKYGPYVAAGYAGKEIITGKD